MADLEQQLSELSAAIAWPPTPQLRVALNVEPRPITFPRWAYAAAAVLAIVALALAYTPTRTAIADFLNLHTTIHRVPQLPTQSTHPSGTLGQRLGLGTPTTMRDAQAQLSWQISVPSALGQPDEVYLQLPPQGPSGGEVTLVYATRPDIKPSAQTGVSVLVTEARGRVDEQFFGKMLGPDATVENVSVNGHAGWWISGHPHEFFFTDSNGNFYSETMRLATNTLVLDDNGTVVRIEGDMTKAQALRIAGSL